MNKYRIFLLIIIIIIVVAIVLYLRQQGISPIGDNFISPEQTVEGSAEPESMTREKPELRFPVPQIQEVTPKKPGQEAGEETAKTLPELDESDETMKRELDQLYGEKTVAELFLIKALIRHFVVTVDNMTSRKLPQRFVFTASPPEKFVVDKRSENEIYLSTENYDRYNRFVNFLTTMDVNRTTALYQKYYPLFQEAYEDLGYPESYFNDRLVSVIDHLLDAPEPDQPVRLVRPKVFYQFADPELESLTAGQKILIRMGPGNSAEVKSVLTEFRQKLTNLPTSGR
ncbi:MAG: DUF3014 domain-containing protein [Gammaproteobacteria bacterium]